MSNLNNIKIKHTYSNVLPKSRKSFSSLNAFTEIHLGLFLVTSSFSHSNNQEAGYWKSRTHTKEEEESKSVTPCIIFTFCFKGNRIPYVMSYGHSIDIQNIGQEEC